MTHLSHTKSKLGQGPFSPTSLRFLARLPLLLLDSFFLATLATAVWLVDRLKPWMRSRTGHANPRVAHIAGAIGYHAHCHHVALSNMRRWLHSQQQNTQTGQPIQLFPGVIQIQTINRCNAACAMCPYPYTIHLEPREIMEDALYTKIVDECSAAPELHDFVPMAKNEPLLDPKLDNRIAEFKAKAAPHQIVELVTNGSALTPARFHRLAAHGLDLITISMSAATEKVYNQVMQGLSWQQVVRNLEAIAQTDTSSVNIFLRFIRQRQNQGEERAFALRWQRHGFNLMAYDVNNRAGVVRGYAGIRRPLRSLVRHLRKFMGRRLFPICPYAVSVAHVLQNGDMPLCANDWQNREILGNVRNSSIRTLYNSPRMQEIRQLMRQGRYDEIAPCKNCSFRHEWL